MSEYGYNRKFNRYVALKYDYENSHIPKFKVEEYFRLKRYFSDLEQKRKSAFKRRKKLEM